MERDFMGLSSKDHLVTVKEESLDASKDSVQRPFPNNVSALSHFMSFRAAEEEKQTQTAFLATSGAEATDTTRKPPSGKPQVKAAMIQLTRVIAGQSCFNPAGDAMKHQPPSVFASHGSGTGITAPWFGSKPAGTPAQLTIFYGGTVNVYNDISPEKAQAIMLLAGNVMSAEFNKAQTRPQGRISSHQKEEGDNVQHNNNGPPTSGIPSPVSVSSHSVGGPNNNSDIKQSGTLAAATTNLEQPKRVGSIGSLAATAMIQSAIPQSRKASLARFLEKRKERAMNSAPYNLCKKSSEMGTPGSDGATSSISISTGKETC